MAGVNQVVTVGDKVRLTKDLMGTVKFVGEIQGRKGIYYGIELTEAKGKSNGTVGNIRYFKCKNKRGLFLRFARIQEVIANNTIHRIGINDCVELYTGNRKSIGVVRYIGIPPRCKDIYYGIQFRKPIGDSDGQYHGTRYFTTNKKCAYFIKASSNHIIKIENKKIKTEKDKRSQDDEEEIIIEKDKNKDDEVKEIQLEMYKDKCINEPIFVIKILSNFSYNDLILSISKMSQYVSSVFDIRFEPTDRDISSGSNGHTNGHKNGIYKKINSILTEEQLSLLRSHSYNFYEFGKFILIEPLIVGIEYEEKGEYNLALSIYEKELLKRDSKSTETLTYLANCLVLLDKFDKAEEYYKLALDINPFCGDILYFYSRLLEYRDKYDEAKNLCNNIMNYVKNNKSINPFIKTPHHPIHYTCYVRLTNKYIKLSLDRYNRSKKSVQEKIQTYINEKKFENNISKIQNLNQNIQKLEKQLIKKEDIIKNKDKQLNIAQNEIKSLKNKIESLNGENNENESSAKIVSENIIKDKEKEMEIKKKKIVKIVKIEKKEEKKEKVEKKVVKVKVKVKVKEEKNMILEYMPLFKRINDKRKEFDTRRNRLLSELLHSESMKSLADCNTDEDRQLLMRDKLELCGVICSFDIGNNDSEKIKRIENKKDLLLEVLQSMSGNKWNNLQLLEECISTIWINLFRSLPSPDMIKTDANDDEMDFRDPSWDHLQLIYELTFHVVTNTHIDKKTMKKHLQGAFLENLIHLFSSADDREPQYVKIIVHAIYGRFMALRKSIRKHLSDYCYKYIYESTLRDSTSWQGLPEILEIFCSIFQGLNVPVKPDYHIVLRNVIVPLHKSFHLDEFHEQLLQCCTQFVTKDPYSAPVILGGMLKFWPKFSPLKEQLFITEIVHILNVCVRHPNIKQSDPAFATITIAVLNKFVECMISPHHQVAERSLMVWRDETVRICVDLHREKIWPNIYKALQYNKEKYWLSAIRNINRQIMSDFKRRDPEFFEKIEKQQQSNDINNNNDQKEKELTKQMREQRWVRLRQLAKPKNK